MKKTKITFEDIKAGDLLEVMVIDAGVKSVVTGIAFAKDRFTEGFKVVHELWKTSEGGMIVAAEEDVAIYRIDVAEVKFEDIRKGDKVRVTTKFANTTTVVEDEVLSKVERSVNAYWVGKSGSVVLYKHVHEAEQTIEILERGE